MGAAEGLLPHRYPLSLTVLGWEMGFEPTIFGTTIRRFNQLSYTHHVWRALLDSNQWLTA